MEYSLVKGRSLSFGRFSEYPELPNLETRKFVFSLIVFIAVTKRNCVQSGLTALLTLGPYFFDELSTRDPVSFIVHQAVICIVFKNQYCAEFASTTVPFTCNFHARWIFSTNQSFYYSCPKKLFHRRMRLQLLFFSLILCFPGHQAPNVQDFWNWVSLKHLISRDNEITLTDLIDNISEHVRNISQNPQRSTVKHAILRFQMIADNDGRHVEYVLLK